VQITGKRADAVLVAMDDWRAIQETLYLLSIPGMRASIRKGMATPVKACLESLDCERLADRLYAAAAKDAKKLRRSGPQNRRPKH